MLLRDRHALIQEAETRFGTIHDVVERFLKSASDVECVVNKKLSKASAEAFSGLLCDAIASGDRPYPSLNAIVKVLKPLLHMQTAIKPSTYLTLHLAFPMLQSARAILRRLIFGSRTGPHFVPPGPHTQLLATVVLAELDKIEHHDMWIAGCLLHPRLRGLGFLCDSEMKRLLRDKFCALFRRISLSCDSQQPSEAEVVERLDPVVGLNNMGEEAFRLEDHYDIPDAEHEGGVSLFKYLGRSFNCVALDIISDSFGIVHFWLFQEKYFLTCAK